MRLFVAFLLADEVRSMLHEACSSLSRRCPGVRWTRAEQLHVTVQFLGEVPDPDVPRITEALKRAAERCAPFTMTVGACGCFPPRGPVRIIWAGAEDASGVMEESVAAMACELGEVGWPPEPRAWQGHITLGRVRDDRSAGTLRDAVAGFRRPPVAQRVASVALMSSVLSPNGAMYDQIQNVPLG